MIGKAREGRGELQGAREIGSRDRARRQRVLYPCAGADCFGDGEEWTTALVLVRSPFLPMAASSGYGQGEGSPEAPPLALPARPCWTLFPKTELYVYNIHGLAKNRCVISRHERVERPSCTCTTDVKSAAHR